MLHQKEKIDFTQKYYQKLLKNVCIRVLWENARDNNGEKDKDGKITRGR